MRKTLEKITLYPYRYIAFSLILFSCTFVNAQDVYLCVWRNPERTMTKIFPDAKDYITVNEKVSPEQAKKIEDRLGFKLLPGQREQFQYFKMTNAQGKIIGYTIAASQKGEYGAIEFVIGFDTKFTIKDLYIQRSRERDVKFKDRSFLDLFKGKNFKDSKVLENAYKGQASLGTTAVIHGIMKEMVSYEEIVMKR